MPGSLLVAYQDVADGAVVERILCREDRSARHTKNHVHSLVLEGLYQCLCSGKRFAHLGLLGRLAWLVYEKTLRLEGCRRMMTSGDVCA